MFKKKHLLRTPLIAVVGLLAFLVVPSAAQAHRVKADAKCVLVGAQPTVQLTVEFVDFPSAAQPTVSGKVWLTEVSGSERSYPSPPPSWNRGKASLVTTWNVSANQDYYTANAANQDYYTANAEFTWKQDGKTKKGTAFDKTEKCPPTPPLPEPPLPEPPPTVTTLPEPPPTVTTPTVTTPAVTTPAVAPPTGGVLPETVASGLASLRGPSGCVKQAFKARVSGRSIAAVSFFVDGKLVKRFTTQQSSYSVKVSPRRFGFGRHKVVAQVEFTAASGTAARRLPLTFRRCAQGAVAPQFTG